MRIAIDLRPLMGGKISGVEVYTESMLHALLKQDTQNEYILFYTGYRRHDFSRFAKHYSNVRLRHIRIPNKILNLCFSLLRWPKVDRLLGGADVLWVPDPRPTPVSKTCRKISTFHDLSFEDFKPSFSLKTRLWHKVLRPKKEAKEAHHIIAVSQFTKTRLTEEYGIPDEKITVIYEAAGDVLRPMGLPKLFDVVKRKYQLPDQYFLCLSTLEPRKNIPAVIKAFLNWKAHTPNPYKLVVAGKAEPAIFKTLDLEHHPDVHLTGFVDEADKALLYEYARAFFYPSHYEGFGLPIVEAMQCGAPVVTSDIGAMREIAGGAAHLVNPDDLKALETAFHQLFSDDVYHAMLREKGLERARSFSWDAAACVLLECLKR